VLGALKLIGGGLVDRNGNRSRRGVGAPPSVKRQSFDFVRHGFFPAVAACVANFGKPDATYEAILYYCCIELLIFNQNKLGGMLP
jgi:hypothetical protein